MNRYNINKVAGQDIHMNIPLSMFTTPLGVDETLNTLITESVDKSLTPYFDGEKIPYKINLVGGLTINFRFYDEQTNTFQQNYESAGFDLDLLNRNSFTKSFFRLYFYDSNETSNSNLVTYEELEVIGTKIPQVKLDKIFLNRSDEVFKTTNNNKTFYIIGRFFNALNGRVYDFINTPISQTTPITISSYSQNNTWWSSPILVINPKNNNGNYNFTLLPFVGANTQNSITLTQRVLL
jgi:hypothetical protein